MAEKIFNKKIASTDGDVDKIGNINAARQSLYGSTFVSAIACFEQALDEYCIMLAKKEGSPWRPSDLKDRGIKRSIKFLKKAFGRALSESQEPWITIFALIGLRNHIVHFGSTLTDSSEHLKLYKSLSNEDYVTFKDVICFNVTQLEKVFRIIMNGFHNFTGTRGS
ncbi:conserved hypothetical protein [Teredinibacter turnerae T7901]|uniref:RiboL-PSP-HEPN domain-containing protein n=2 Tax=Teredinibacter turnerae TaxID=2426 RepID=C6AR09_TERTT|nr:conserved hypothetical protein [Teredinibacter turnerae T7901]